MKVGSNRLDNRLEYLGAWSGAAWFFFTAAGFGGSGLIPVLSPATSATDLATFVADNKYRILIGMMVLLIGSYTFLMTWSLTLAHQIRKYANPSRLVSYLIIAVGLNGAVIGMLCGVIGSAMAYRVGSVSPATTQMLYDIIFFLFLIPWPPFLLWQFVTAFAILSDTNTHVMFPRWMGYFSLWAGALEMFSALCVYWYRGPFSYNGLVGFWVPGVSFFLWVAVFTYMQIKRWPRVRDIEPGPAAHEAVNPTGRHDTITALPQTATI